jgi:predicted RNase H-like HicB family nuclease
MKIDEIYRYAYVKKPLNEVYPDESMVPPEFYFEWLKDSYDYVRIHSDEEIREFLTLTPEQIMEWLTEAIEFVWEAKRTKNQIPPRFEDDN